MKGILLLNGTPYTGTIDAQDAYVVCCDGAYAWAKDKVRIDRNVGDFDSLNYLPTPPPKEVYPSEKDCTDGEIGLRALLSHGCDSIEIYGGGGGREDHFLGNLHLLYYAMQHNTPARLFTERTEIFPARGKIKFSVPVGTTLSLLPFSGEAHIVSSEGLKYPLNGLTLSYGSCRGVSNLASSQEVCLHCAEGCVLVLINRTKGM